MYLCTFVKSIILTESVLSESTTRNKIALRYNVQSNAL